MNTKILARFLLAAGCMIVTSNAAADPIDLDPGDSYPVEIYITSPAGTTVSQFYFDSSYAMTLSDSNFLIDANFNSDGTLNSWNGVTLTTAIDTHSQISLDEVFATLVWQSGSANNNANLNAFTGVMSVDLEFKITFTGTWLGVGETCETGAFLVSMSTTGNTMPYTALTGVDYTYAHGYFEAVSNGFNIPAIGGATCTTAHKGALMSNLAVNGTTNLSAMSIFMGYPTYEYSGLKIVGS
jgi:hypothetical protein